MKTDVCCEGILVYDGKQVKAILILQILVEILFLIVIVKWDKMKAILMLQKLVEMLF